MKNSQGIRPNWRNRGQEKKRFSFERAFKFTAKRERNIKATTQSAFHVSRCLIQLFIFFVCFSFNAEAQTKLCPVQSDSVFIVFHFWVKLWMNLQTSALTKYSVAPAFCVISFEICSACKNNMHLYSMKGGPIDTTRTRDADCNLHQLNDKVCFSFVVERDTLPDQLYQFVV